MGAKILQQPITYILAWVWLQTMIENAVKWMRAAALCTMSHSITYHFIQIRWRLPFLLRFIDCHGPVIEKFSTNIQRTNFSFLSTFSLLSLGAVWRDTAQLDFTLLLLVVNVQWPCNHLKELLKWPEQINPLRNNNNNETVHLFSLIRWIWNYLTKYEANTKCEWWHATIKATYLYVKSHLIPLNKRLITNERNTISSENKQKLLRYKFQEVCFKRQWRMNKNDLLFVDHSMQFDFLQAYD